jgi:hypothetical protein
VSGVQAQATVPAGVLLAVVVFFLSSCFIDVTTTPAATAITTTPITEPMIARRRRLLRAASARSAISFSRRARAAARCRSLVDDTVFLLLLWASVNYDWALGDGATEAAAPKVRLVMVIFLVGVTLSPAALALVGILLIVVTVFIPPATLPMIGYSGDAGL